MSLWAANGAASSNSPTHTADMYRANSVNQAAYFMNTNPGALLDSGVATKQVFGVYGVTNTQVIASETGQSTGNTSHPIRFLSPGWYTVKQGMGPITNFVIVTPGSGYSNNDKFAATSAYVANATVNTTANVLTNAAGALVGFSNLVNSGGLFINTTATTLAITNTSGGSPNGTLGVANIVLGGRAGRISRECIISLPSMTSNSTSANNPLFPNI